MEGEHDYSKAVHFALSRNSYFTKNSGKWVVMDSWLTHQWLTHQHKNHGFLRYCADVLTEDLYYPWTNGTNAAEWVRKKNLA